MQLRLIVAFVLLAFSSGVTSSEIGGLSGELLSKLEDLKASKGLLDRGKIYTEKEIERDVLKVENDKLFEAGLSLMVSLKSNRTVYENLPLNEWAKATDALIEIDSWMSSRVAWGNLIIKSYVAEMIMRSIYVRLSNGPAKEEVDAYHAVIKDLDARLPSKVAMAVIAAGYYQISIDEEVIGLSYGRNQVVYEQLRRLEGSAANDISNTVFKSVDLKREHDEDVVDEERVFVKAKDFVYFYSNPVPFVVAFSSYYRSLLWYLYLYSSFHQESAGINHSWGALSNDKIVGFYIDSGFSELSVPTAVLPANRDEASSQRYFRDIRNGKVVDALSLVFGPEKALSRRSLFQSLHGLE